MKCHVIFSQTQVISRTINTSNGASQTVSQFVFTPHVSVSGTLQVGGHAHVQGNMRVSGIGYVPTLLFADGTSTRSWLPVITLSAALTDLQAFMYSQNAATQNSILGLSIQNANLQSAIWVIGNTLNKGITFSGPSFDIYTPVQAQWNGGKPIVSMSQYGEINFYSNPYLNYNTIYLKGTGDYSNGLSYTDSFGTTAGIGGPVLFGALGGALGTRSGWDNAQGKAALTWDDNQNVVVVGRLGIGNNAPAAGLDVDGSARIRGNLSIVGGNLFVNGKPLRGMTDHFLQTTAPGLVCRTVPLNLVNNQPTPEWYHCNTSPGRTLDAQGACSFCEAVTVPAVGFSAPVTMNDNVEVWGTLKIGKSSLYITGTQTANNQFANQLYSASGPLYINSNNTAVTPQHTLLNVNGANVGIGTQNPTKKLHVNGDIYATGSITSEQGAILLGTPTFIPNPGITVQTNYMAFTNGNGIWFGTGANHPYTMFLKDGKVSIGGGSPPSISSATFNVTGNARISGPLNVSSLVFPDGTSMNSAGGALAGATGWLFTPRSGEIPAKISTADFNYHVGIGTDADNTHKLSVNGSTVIYGSLHTLNNAHIGGTIITNTLGIGTSTFTVGAQNYALAVNGRAIVKGIRSQVNGWSDFVFDKNYKLDKLEDVEVFIKTHKHLKDIPSAAEVQRAGGIDLAEMNAKLLQKVEELTLYTIELNKRLKELESRK